MQSFNYKSFMCIASTNTDKLNFLRHCFVVLCNYVDLEIVMTIYQYSSCHMITKLFFITLDSEQKDVLYHIGKGSYQFCTYILVYSGKILFWLVCTFFKVMFKFSLSFYLTLIYSLCHYYYFRISCQIEN